MMHNNSIRSLVFILISALGPSVVVTSAYAADQSKQSSNDSSQAQNQDSGAERVNVENIKEKYWARGDETELGVVQNRAYSKANKWEVGVYGGAVLTDPFLDVKNAGFSLGYHFSEYFEVRANMWKDFASGSTALGTFQSTLGGETNYNKPKAYYGGEAVGSLLYGKLSVLGKSIIYFDLHLLGGLGATNTQNGTYVTPHVGVGQQVYVSKSTSISLDYRLMYYHEQIVERVIPTKIGQDVGSRNNFSNVITLGVNFMFGGPKEKSGAAKQ